MTENKVTEQTVEVAEVNPLERLKNLTPAQLLSNARLPDESFELYKERRKFVSAYTKQHLKGRRIK